MTANTYLTRDVWVVGTNTDLTEGRGEEYAMAVTDIKETAVRLAKGKGAARHRRHNHQSPSCETPWYIPLVGAWKDNPGVEGGHSGLETQRAKRDCPGESRGSGADCGRHTSTYGGVMNATMRHVTVLN